MENNHTLPPPPPPPPPRIQPLPKKVIDQIAAGEIIQRPASLIKELIENSLDASSTTVDIQISNGGLSSISITDDGSGFHKDDLLLAAERFATSKLVKFDDLKSIKTFGFRGEALASASMVGRLSITSRRRTSSTSSSSCAYKLSYTEGKPNSTKPFPSAGKDGTIIKIEDLFYNIPSRKKSFEGTKKENEEYYKILNVVQRYAVHCSQIGVSFVCRKKAGVTDLNTVTIPSLKKLQQLLKRIPQATQQQTQEQSQEQKTLAITAMKETIGHVFGTQLVNELLTLDVSEGDVETVDRQALQLQLHDEETDSNKVDNVVVNSQNQHQESQQMHQIYENVTIQSDSSCSNTNNNTQSSQILDTFAFKAFGLLTNASFCGSKSSSAFILFINDRLVESAPIRRSIEGMYSDILPRGVKPFIYLSLQLPGIHIDVNIHPTKREVAILHEEKLCTALANATMKLLCSMKSSKTFYTQDVNCSQSNNTNNNDDPPTMSMTQIQESNNENIKKRKFKSSNSTSQPPDEKKKMQMTLLEETIPLSSKKKRDVQPKDLIRINTAAEKGSIEPFLVNSTTTTSSISNNITTAASSREQIEYSQIFEHSSTCEFANNPKRIDFNQPGAFASICRCQIERPGFKNSQQSISSQSSVVSNIQVPRPKKISQTECSYASIQFLRKDIITRSHHELTTKLRESVFVGCVSRHRSLIQSGIELLMINHIELARELFYQLALLQFGEFQKASLGSNGMDVSALVTKALQFDDAQSLFMPEQSEDKTFNLDFQTKITRQVLQCLASRGKTSTYFHCLKCHNRYVR